MNIVTGFSSVRISLDKPKVQVQINFIIISALHTPALSIVRGIRYRKWSVGGQISQNAVISSQMIRPFDLRASNESQRISTVSFCFGLDDKMYAFVAIMMLKSNVNCVCARISQNFDMKALILLIAVFINGQYSMALTLLILLIFVYSI